jgi:hypothetical protein
MRSLKTILTAAGKMKRSNDINEDIIIFTVLEEVNIPKFV